MTCKRYSYKWPGLAKFTEALASHNNNPTATAKHFGVSKSTIYEWIKANNIHFQPQTTPQNISNNEGEDMSKKDCFVSSESARVIPYAFDGKEIQVIESQADDVLMTDRQIGEVLGYSQPAAAISQLVSRYADELEQHSTIINLITVDGKERSVRVWREQGVYLITMFSNQPKAKAFRQFAAQTLYNVRRQQNISGPTLADLAQLVGLRTNQLESRIETQDQRLQILEDRNQALEQALKDAPIQNAEQIAADVVASLQDLNAVKAHLTTLVHAIYHKAKELPQSDSFAWQYSHYSRIWPAVHGYAVPRVSSKDEYLTIAQTASAIRGAEMILSKLGGEIPKQPEQLRINFEHQAAS